MVGKYTSKIYIISIIICVLLVCITIVGVIYTPQWALFGGIQILLLSGWLIQAMSEFKRSKMIDNSASEILRLFTIVIPIWRRHIDEVISFSTIETSTQTDEIKGIIQLLDNELVSVKDIVGHIEESQQESEALLGKKKSRINVAVKELKHIISLHSGVDEKINKVLVSLQSHDRVCQVLNLLLNDMELIFDALNERNYEKSFNAEILLKDMKLKNIEETDACEPHSLLSKDSSDKNKSNVTYF